MAIERPGAIPPHQRDLVVPNDPTRPVQEPLSVTLPDEAASRAAGAAVSLPPSTSHTDASLVQTPPRTEPVVQTAPTPDIPAPRAAATEQTGPRPSESVDRNTSGTSATEPPTTETATIYISSEPTKATHQTVLAAEEPKKGIVHGQVPTQRAPTKDTPPTAEVVFSSEEIAETETAPVKAIEPTIAARLERVFGREDVQMDLGDIADVAVISGEVSELVPVEQHELPVVERLTSHLVRFGLTENPQFAVSVRDGERHLILTGYGEVERPEPVKVADTSEPAEQTVTESAKEKGGQLPAQRTDRETDTSSKQLVPALIPQQQATDRGTESKIKTSPDDTAATEVEIQRQAAEVRRNRVGYLHMQGRSITEIAEALRIDPKRVSRDLSRWYTEKAEKEGTDRETRRRTPEEMEALRAAVKEDAETMSRAEIREEYGLSPSQLSKLLRDEPYPRKRPEPKPTPEPAVTQLPPPEGPTPDSVVTSLKPTGRYRTPEQIAGLRAAIVRDSRAGLSFDEIQARYELSRAYLAQIRKEEGVAAKSAPHITPEEKADIIKDSTTMNIDQLVRKYGRTSSNIRNVLYEAGIKQERGHSQTLLGLWEAGESRPSYPELLAMALEAGLTRDQFHHAADYLRDLEYDIPRAGDENTSS